MATVSVVIAAYRAEETLGKAIASLQAQTMQDWEALIIDDASDDGTYEFALKLAESDHRVRVFQLKENGGPSAARNVGIQNAIGQWIAVLDADDRFTSSRLQDLLSAAQSTPCDVLFDNMTSATSDLEYPSFPYWPGWRDKPRVISITEMIRGCSGAVSPTYSILKPFIRRSFLLEKGIGYSPALRQGEDVHFHLTMMLSGAITKRLSSIGYLYTQPEKANTSHASKSNINHRLKSTQMIKSTWWKSLSVSQKFWLMVRLNNVKYIDQYAKFRDEIISGHYLSAIALATKTPWVLLKVVLLIVRRLRKHGFTH